MIMERREALKSKHYGPWSISVGEESKLNGYHEIPHAV